MNQGNRIMPLSINFYKETRKKLLSFLEEVVEIGRASCRERV